MDQFQERWRSEGRWQLIGYAFMAPYLLLFLIFVVGPVVSAIYLSFTYFNILEAPRWIGWTNYRSLLVDDEIFLIAIANTFTFAFVTGPVSFVASFLLAWLLNRMRFRTIYVLAYYTPSIGSAIAASFVWRILLSGDRYGTLNNALISTGILDEPIQFLAEQAYIMPAIIVVSLWDEPGHRVPCLSGRSADCPQRAVRGGQGGRHSQRLG